MPEEVEFRNRNFNISQFATMADLLQVKKMLKVALGCVQDGLEALKSDTAKSGLNGAPTMEVLRKDFIGIISLIYSYSSRLWIALGKQPPTPSAAVPTLQEISNHIRSLYGCAIAFRDLDGKTFSAEVQTSATDILFALKVMLEGYSAQQRGEDMMRKTAALHEVCEKGKNLSVDNREAVLKIWKQDSEALKDAIKEMNALLNPKSTEHIDETSDGWGDLLDDEVGGVELSEDDIVTVKKALVVLERISSFRKQIQKTFLSAVSAGSTLSATRYDRVLRASREMVPLVDDAVACLDTPPLEVDDCRSILADLCQSIRSLLEICSEAPEDVSDALEKLDITAHVAMPDDRSGLPSLVVTVDEIARAIQTI